MVLTLTVPVGFVIQFDEASTFNQPTGGWDVHAVKNGGHGKHAFVIGMVLTLMLLVLCHSV
jgi:hypothetical protein